jgi:hypothetical protein
MVMVLIWPRHFMKICKAKVLDRRAASDSRPAQGVRRGKLGNQQAEGSQQLEADCEYCWADTALLALQREAQFRWIIICSFTAAPTRIEKTAKAE